MTSSNTESSDPVLPGLSDSSFPGLSGANGWYVKSGDGHSGPIDSVQLQERLAQSGDNPLVCQRGFSRWYRASEVRAILDRSLEWDKQTVEGLSDFQKTFLDGLARLNQVHEKAKVERQEIQTHRAEASVPAGRPEIEIYRELMSEVIPAPKVEPSIQQILEVQEAAESFAEDSGLDFIAELPRDYYLFKGRLRLGKRRRAWAAVFWSTISAGLSFPFWAAEVRREVFWHLGVDVYRERFPGYLRFFPMVHLVSAGLLARAIRRMETENGYKATSVPLAVLLSVVPPVYVGYIQRKINRHWMSHARHGLREGMIR